MNLLKQLAERGLEKTPAPWHPFKLGNFWLIRLYPYRAAERASEKYPAEELKRRRDECLAQSFSWIFWNTALKLFEEKS